MNNAETLGFYTELQLFLNNHQLGEGATLQFPATLTPAQRRTVRALADKLNLKHTTHGVGPERFITISRNTSPQEPVSELSVPTVTSPDLQRSSGLQPFPLVQPIMSEDRLHLTDTLRSPGAPAPRLRTVASMGNLRQGNQPPDPSTMPPLPQRPVPQYDLLSQFEQFDPFQRQPLVHRSSQESALSSQGSRQFGYNPLHSSQPARQPIGPPPEQPRGFSERPSREAFLDRPSREGFTQIRPIGHGAKTPSHGSLSHGSSRESRVGSEQSVIDLQVQGSIPHPSEYQ
jgi:R3H domain